MTEIVFAKIAGNDVHKKDREQKFRPEVANCSKGHLSLDNTCEDIEDTLNNRCLYLHNNIGLNKSITRVRYKSTHGFPAWCPHQLYVIAKVDFALR